MKLVSFFLLSILFFSQVFAQSVYTVHTVPNPRTSHGGFISDPGNSLSDKELQALNADLIKLEKESSAEFAIVILPSIGTVVPKDFAVELFNTWGIGKKGKDNGLLLLLVMDQRRWEFETGYGLEGTLPDAILKRIGEDKLVPKLKQRRMADGFADVIGEVTRKIKNEPEPIIADTKKTDPMKNIFDTYEPPLMQRIATGFFRYFFYFSIFYIIAFYAGVYYLKNIKKVKNSLLFSDHLINWKLVFIGLIPYALRAIFIILTYHYIYIIPILFPAYLFIAISILILLTQHYFTLEKGFYKEPYDYYKEIDQSFRSGEMLLISLLFPLPSLLFVGYSMIKRRKLRLATRICKKCNAEMIRLDEQKDDFFLKDGQKIEEKIGSIDYDVWFCEKCNDVKIYAYEALFTSYSKCPSCTYKTYFTESDTVTVSPTCTSSGSGIRRYACKNCSYTTSNTYTIPARDCTKSSSSSSSYGSSSSSYRSSSSSSSGSSFGGGRSGGGGAGGSW